MVPTIPTGPSSAASRKYSSPKRESYVLSIQESSVPVKTRNNTNLAVKLWTDWAISRNNDSTGQFEVREYLEAASSLSAARFESTGLIQHGSYTIGCKRKTQENSIILEVNTKWRILYQYKVTDVFCGKTSYCIRP